MLLQMLFLTFVISTNALPTPMLQTTTGDEHTKMQYETQKDSKPDSKEKISGSFWTNYKNITDDETEIVKEILEEFSRNLERDVTESLGKQLRNEKFDDFIVIYDAVPDDAINNIKEKFPPGFPELKEETARDIMNKLRLNVLCTKHRIDEVINGPTGERLVLILADHNVPTEGHETTLMLETLLVTFVITTNALPTPTLQTTTGSENTEIPNEIQKDINLVHYMQNFKNELSEYVLTQYKNLTLHEAERVKEILEEFLIVFANDLRQSLEKQYRNENFDELRSVDDGLPDDTFDSIKEKLRTEFPEVNEDTAKDIVYKLRVNLFCTRQKLDELINGSRRAQQEIEIENDK